jgi:hypothetical protein
VKNYYYFAATLPAIGYGDSPPMTSDGFRALCLDLLDERDAALVDFCTYSTSGKADPPSDTGSGFIDLFLSREKTLVLNLAYLRAAKLKRTSPGDPPHDVPHAEAVARAAFEMDDPLEAELAIDRGRWDALDAMVGVDLFSVNNIYAYLLRLQLLERKSLFDAAKGETGYKSRYDGILSEYNDKGSA